MGIAMPGAAAMPGFGDMRPKLCSDQGGEGGGSGPGWEAMGEGKRERVPLKLRSE